MPRMRRMYPPKLRRQMVELVRAGPTSQELAQEFEPNAQSIHNRVRQADLDEGRRADGLTCKERQELSWLLGVSNSGYYAWRHRVPSKRFFSDQALTCRIRAFHELSRGTYGVAHICRDLSEEGIRVSRKRIARLMREARLSGVSRRCFVRTTVRNGEERPPQDLVERNFTAEGPDHLWVAEITYVPTWFAFLYLAVVLDAWSRLVMSWSMAIHLCGPSW